MRRARLTIDLPFTLPLPDGEYLVRLGKETFDIGLELVAQVTGKPDVDNSVVVMPATGRVESAGAGVEIPGAGSRHTRAYVDFHMDSPGSITEERESRWKTKCHRYLNVFLDSYRVQFEDERVYSLSPAEFYSVRYGYAPRWAVKADDGSESIGVTFGEHPLEIRAGPTIGGERLEQFKGDLADESPTALVLVLLMDSRTARSRGDFRASVVHAGTALDIAVEDVARNLLSARGELSQEKLDELERRTTKPIMEQEIARLLGSHLLQSESWTAFEPTIRHLRNRVIHDAYEPTTEEVDAAFDAIKGLIEYLLDEEAKSTVARKTTP